MGARSSIFISRAREKMHGLGETKGTSPQVLPKLPPLHLLSVMEQLSHLPKEVVSVVCKKVG